MQVVILAGGLGTRLRPITYEIPKPMVPINGRPYLEYQIKYLKDQGFTDIVILVGYLGQQIISYFGNGEKFGVDIRYSIETEPLGTGGGLKLAEELLENEFLLIYGDSFLPIDLNDLVEKYNQAGKKCSMVIYDNSDNTTVIPNVAIDHNNRVIKYLKNSNDPDLHYVESGILILRKDVIQRIPSNIKISLEERMFPVLIEENDLFSYITKQRFFDIGTPERLDVISKYFYDNFKNAIYAKLLRRWYGPT